MASYFTHGFIAMSKEPPTVNFCWIWRKIPSNNEHWFSDWDTQPLVNWITTTSHLLLSHDGWIFDFNLKNNCKASNSPNLFFRSNWISYKSCSWKLFIVSWISLFPIRIFVKWLNSFTSTFVEKTSRFSKILVLQNIEKYIFVITSPVVIGGHDNCKISLKILSNTLILLIDQLL